MDYTSINLEGGYLGIIMDISRQSEISEMSSNFTFTQIPLEKS